MKVTENMSIERYSHVMHIVSNVEASLRPELSAMDVLRATFPAGTVSGAPKIRAMEIIDELEPTKRGVYAGAVGYLGFNGDMATVCLNGRGRHEDRAHDQEDREFVLPVGREVKEIAREHTVGQHEGCDDQRNRRQQHNHPIETVECKTKEAAGRRRRLHRFKFRNGMRH